MTFEKLSKYFCVAALGLTACTSQPPELGGTATDTENTIAGIVVRSDGTPSANSRVRMARLASKDDPTVIPELQETMTNDSGEFKFETAIADTFQLAVVDSAAKELTYLPKITAESKDFESIKLEKAAILTSVLYYEEITDPEVAVGSHFMVYIPGTPFYQSIFAKDPFSMMVPAGCWWVSFYPGDPQIVVKLQESGVPDTLVYQTLDMKDTLEAGDTLKIGPLNWGTEAKKDTVVEEPEEKIGYLTGVVMDPKGNAVSGAQVQLILDLYAFSFVDGDSTVFKPMASTDSTGRWYLPMPEVVPDDSFRVEIFHFNENKVDGATTSRYVMASEVKGNKDTLFLGVDFIDKPSHLISSVNLVVDKMDTNQSENCMMNSVVIGFKGTSQFVREVTCNPLEIDNVPSGKQELVLYSGDPKVISTIQKNKWPIQHYVAHTFVSVAPNDTLNQQGMTYAPPVLQQGMLYPPASEK